ncbi:acyl-CoA dehydrogenase family protein [Gordonia alkanivorans]|uniref:acyl-CoA dehydrogenase family protein n=1 Tax=Gordonia alkanivorans TaxID=84096 RepID=UPI00244B7B7D|nr:acyl-CoA dehydrogenase family protein [Gordonia alkanivorans]MDH3047287.1 acyl-CoA/acyl-ACP dehydrogenase [Gordonia alkanivorans]
MDLLPSDDQSQLVEAASEFLAARFPIDGIRRNRDAASIIDAQVWREAAEMGLLTLGLDERFGGSGQAIDDEALVFHALARQLASGPFLSSTLGARLAAYAGDTDLAEAIGSGETMVGLAELRGDGRVDADGFKGAFDLLDCAGCTHALLVVRDGAALVEIAEFGDVRAVAAVDPGSRLSTATVADGRIHSWVPASVDWIWARALVLNSAFLSGLAAAITEMSTEFAKTRVQFGRPIGANQAIKHAIVDMAVRTESAWAQTLFAAAAVKAGRADAEFQILAAKTVAGTAAMNNGAASIQVHGGMGYTSEHNAHLYLKRAVVHRQLLSAPSTVLADFLELKAAQ